MVKVIALINQKGGVGKTTSAVNIGAGLSRLGKKVLLVDLDPQAHLTYSLHIPGHELEHTLYQILKHGSRLADAIQKADDLDVVPSTLDLSGVEIELANTPGREFLLREALADQTSYHYVLLDCPPSLGLLTLNALTAAKEIFIPLQTEFLALQGMSKLLDTVAVVQKRLNPELKVTGVIATRYDQRKVLNREVVEKIREHFGAKVFHTLIRDNIALAEAPGYGKTIFEYRPASPGAEDYLALCREIVKRADGVTV